MATLNNIIDLSKLVNKNVDFISGRTYGEQEAIKANLMEHIKNNEKIIIKVDEKLVKAINDSFIKGFFSEVFSKLKTKDNVKTFFEVQGDEYFVRLFEKNWTILEASVSDVL